MMRRAKIHGSYDLVIKEKKGRKKYKCPVCGKPVPVKGTCSWKCWRRLLDMDHNKTGG